MALGKRRFQVVDRAGLYRPEAGFVERREFLETRTQLRRVRDPLSKRLGSGKVEELPAARRRVEAIREVRDRTVGLEQEGKRVAVRGKVLGKTGGVLGRLGLDPGESALGLRFDCTHCLPVEVEQVVGEAEASLHLKLAHGDAATCGDVQFVSALDDPAGRGEVQVDLTPGFLFGGLRHRLASLLVNPRDSASRLPHEADFV